MTNTCILIEMTLKAPKGFITQIQIGLSPPFLRNLLKIAYRIYVPIPHWSIIMNLVMLIHSICCFVQRLHCHLPEKEWGRNFRLALFHFLLILNTSVLEIFFNHLLFGVVSLQLLSSQHCHYTFLSNGLFHEIQYIFIVSLYIASFFFFLRATFICISLHNLIDD